MDEAQEILLSSLSSAGISLPAGVCSTRGLTPDALVSICAQTLRLIGGDSPPSLPDSLPVPTLERFKICADAAAAVSSLGYRGDLSFHQFLYPSDEDSYKLVRFMVERLSESSEGRKAADNLVNRSNSNSEAVGDSFRGQSGGSTDAGLFKSELVESSEKESPCSKKAVEDLAEESKNSDGESFTQRENTYLAELERELASQQVKLSKLRYEVENLRNQEKVLVEKTHAKTLETQNLESKYDILKATLEMTLDDQHSVGFNVKELNEQVEAQRRNLLEVESKW